MVGLSLPRVQELLDGAAGLRVAVVGDLILDVYLSGKASRISPEAPVPVVHVTQERAALGGAANVAANVIALGAECSLVGVIGRDAAGEQLRRALAEQEGRPIRAALVEHPTRPTTTKTRVMARHQQVVRYDREDADDLPRETQTELRSMLRQVIAEADVLVLEDYDKGVLTSEVIAAALSFARERGIPSVVDPKFRHFWHYTGATVFKPNLLELSAAMGAEIGPDDESRFQEARRRLGCEHLLVTLGEKGMVLCSAGEDPVTIPALAREVYDVSGAGDTVSAYVAVALAAGATPEEAAVLANHAAAIEVGKPGVATVSATELQGALSAGEMLAGLPAD